MQRTRTRKRRLSRDAEATLVNDEGNTHTEAAYLRLELDWLGARVATTTWDFALIPSITAEVREQCFFWDHCRADWKCHAAIWEDGVHSCPLHRSTSPTTHDASHEAALHDPIRQQTSADRHDLPPECCGQADNQTSTWCGTYFANTMYNQQCLTKLSTLIKRVHCAVTFTTLVVITSWG